MDRPLVRGASRLGLVLGPASARAGPGNCNIANKTGDVSASSHAVVSSRAILIFKVLGRRQVNTLGLCKCVGLVHPHR